MSDEVTIDATSTANGNKDKRPLIDPDTGWNRLMVEQMAQSIRFAHEVQPSSYAVYAIQNGALVLAVESFAVLTIAAPSTSGDILLKGNPAEDRFGEIAPETIKISAYKQFQGFLVRCQRDSWLRILQTHRGEHEEGIRWAAARVKTRSTWAHKHSAEVLGEIERICGEDLPHPAYEVIPPVGSSPSYSGEHGDSLEAIRNHFAFSALHYTDAQIASFYTALQTKGFVVLSDISGTGKSKIAQGFVGLLPDKAIPREVALAAQEDLIPRVVQTTTKNSALVNFPRKLIERFPLPGPGVKTFVDVEFEGLSQQCVFNTIVQDNSAVYRLYFSGNLRQRITQLDLGTMLYFRPIVDNDAAVLVGFEIRRSQDIAVSPDQPEPALRSESNHLFLSVRPDWRDSTSLLGYFNPLTQTYEWTDFLRFILRAVESYRAADGLAWFVILDEMNLAHVEYYFADLLSVLESGRPSGPADDLVGFTREPLRTTYPDTLDDEVPPREIHLPPNLYIIGTVNMDETTHAFSPKVLDRAFTIELTDVSFVGYPPVAATNGATGLADADSQALLMAFTRDGRFHGVDKVEVAQAVANHPEIRDRLDELNRLLMKDRFHFGYRIFDEICQYIVNNDFNRMMSFEDAFDQAVFMKVLPKFSGPRSRLRGPLISVLAWAIDPAEPLTKQVVTDLDSYLAGTSEALRTRAEAAAAPTVAKRALDMLERVEMDGFVSFG